MNERGHILTRCPAINNRLRGPQPRVDINILKCPGRGPTGPERVRVVAGNTEGAFDLATFKTTIFSEMQIHACGIVRTGYKKLRGGQMQTVGPRT